MIEGPINVEEFTELRKRIEIHTIFWKLIFENYNTNEEINNLKKYRNILIDSSSFLSQKKLKKLSNDKKILATVHQSLYPWIYNHRFKSLADIIKNSNGKGIVVCTGDKHFKFARSTIDTFRNVLKTKLPIEVFYYGENDLSKVNRNILTSYDEVYVTDISKYFDNKVIDISGWAIKPFAILASRFEEVILIDADVVYLRDPIELFEDEGYIEKGTLFFRDRTLYPGSHPGSIWLKSWMINPLPETKALRFWNEITAHEMESSTVVMNKTKNILGLLATCKLNEKRIREDVVYKYVYGDKETFWMGFDIARQHYNMNSVPCTYIGETIQAGNDKILCGHIGHMLSNGKFMFWNGHIVKDKNKVINENSLINFDSYFIDDDDGEWTPDLSCLKLKKDPTPLNDNELQNLNTILNREKQNHFVIPELKVL
ncbi:hypothetical protein H8356DRAFT_1728669 [Neocallimastix lanati (nom. inval.)]|nr:hypothetical protein H8356DRAFT_1728669 [Neocallimastix sp. JGI-2020a]